MNNLWFNIRFGTYHLQWGPDGWSFKQNPRQVYLRKEFPDWSWFAVYCAFGKHFEH